MSKKIITALALSIIAAGMSVSFEQYIHTSIDGDIVPIVLPMETYATVLHDPFGFEAISKNEHYSGAGRYFIHLTLNFIFHPVYSVTKKIYNDPISSLYITSAIFQWFCHWLLVLVFALYANIARKFSVTHFLIAAALSIPFFQFANCCYNTSLIDSAVTYTAFYAFPLALLMLFYYPLLRGIFYEGATLSHGARILMPLMGVFLIFSGPLTPVIGILTGAVTILLYLMKNQNGSSLLDFKNVFRNFRSQPFMIKVILPVLMVLWLYAFFLGTYNMENVTNVSVLQRYKLMFTSLPHYLFTGGLPFLFVLLAINFFMIKIFYPEVLRSKNFSNLVFFASACLLYILLLPLGGYRGYRPMIVRYDVTMPLTFFLVVTIQNGILFLLSHLDSMYKWSYVVLVSLILILFWSKNFPLRDSRKEQQAMLTILQNSHSDSVVCLPYSSNFFAWDKIDDPGKSYYVRQMLYDWGITDRQVIFYQK